MSLPGLEGNNVTLDSHAAWKYIEKSPYLTPQATKLVRFVIWCIPPLIYLK